MGANVHEIFDITYRPIKMRESAASTIQCNKIMNTLEELPSKTQ
jgi:hypothetical protein